MDSPSHKEKLLADGWKEYGQLHDSDNIAWTILSKSFFAGSKFQIGAEDRNPSPIIIQPAKSDNPATLINSLQKMLAPVALYPDPILANVLPASTYPDEIQQAYVWLQANPNPNQGIVESMNWEPSVKALVFYPYVLQVMNSDLAWLQSLGSAFSMDQPDVLSAIQTLRAQAIASGNLLTTSEVQVIQDSGMVYLQPASPEVIYVPQYDPYDVYYGHTMIVYGARRAIGPWLRCGLDWRARAVWFGNWRDGWIFNGSRWQLNHDWKHPQQWQHDNRFGNPPTLARSNWKTPVAMPTRPRPTATPPVVSPRTVVMPKPVTVPPRQTTQTPGAVGAP